MVYSFQGVSTMPVIKYSVILTDSERLELTDLITKGSATAKMIMHANILLEADEGIGKRRRREQEIAKLFHVNKQTVHTIRKTYATKGLAAAIGRKRRDSPPINPRITGDVEARIIAIGCGTPPEGFAKWTVRLLADKAIELQIIDSISYVSVHRLLKKTSSNRT